MTNEQEYIGFIRYVGPSVERGYLDARKSAEALLGLDEALRYFVGRQSPNIGRLEYEIPVRIDKGSWLALIPHDIPSWLITALGAGVTSYFVTAANKMAENDFRETGLRSIFKKALEAIQWTIRIGKHLGSISRRTFDRVQWRNGNSEIGIPNDKGEILFVPLEFFQLYEHVPVHILFKLVSVVTEERCLDVAVKLNGHEELESVCYKHKYVFCDEDDTVLFPELEHGMEVELDGLVTRGNENANSLGFQYNDHILTCYPREGSIVRFKSALFLRSRMKGRITRADKFGNLIELRPKIVFDEVYPLEKDTDTKDTQPLLFDEDK